MSRPTRCLTSSSNEINAWIRDMTARPPIVARDYLDSQRTTHLRNTLPTSLRIAPSMSHAGTPNVDEASSTLPNAHHLVYFHPQSTFDLLGADGSSTEYNAPAPYSRRMWAGGSLEWNTATPLRIGTTVTELTRVAAVEHKKDMIFVHQEKRYYPEGASLPEKRGADSADCDRGWGVKERRIHVFRTDEAVKAGLVAAAGKMNAPSTPATISHLAPEWSSSPDGGTVTFTYTPTSPLLFRYSALTYNAHKIHYDRDWVRNVEGHPDLVVHGPLTATLLVELASGVGRRLGRHLLKFDYRATKGMYVGRQVTLQGSIRPAQSASMEPVIIDLVAEQSGAVGMKATAVLQ